MRIKKMWNWSPSEQSDDFYLLKAKASENSRGNDENELLDCDFCEN
jgi:hypothetical protein